MFWLKCYRFIGFLLDREMRASAEGLCASTSSGFNDMHGAATRFGIHLLVCLIVVVKTLVRPM